jgi:hypothetical protein
MTAVATSYGADQLGNAAELTNGYQAAFIAAAGVAALAAFVALALIRAAKAEAGETGPEVSKAVGEPERLAA